MSREFELKYTATAAQLTQIQAAFPGPYQVTTMETTYYDTPDHRLAARKWTLRQRMENGVPIYTLKTPAQNAGRNEWETGSNGGIDTAIPVLCKLSGLWELSTLTQDGVCTVCGARFLRRSCQIDLGCATLELSLDQGILSGGSRTHPLTEVEAEHKQGDETITRHWAEHLAARFGLVVEPESKFCRALALAKECEYGTI